MRIHALLCAGAASWVLLGCATRPEPLSKDIAVLGIPAATPACTNTTDNGVSCVIDLRVADKGVDSCEISLVNADDDLIPLGRGVRGTHIYWRLVAPGTDYEFTEDDGIVFVDNFRPRGFANGRRLADDKKAYRWRNVNNGRRVYAYIVNVTNASGSRECFLDPWIRTK